MVGKGKGFEWNCCSGSAQFLKGAEDRAGKATRGPAKSLINVLQNGGDRGWANLAHQLIFLEYPHFLSHFL
jgi:hypothetical protein